MAMPIDVARAELKSRGLHVADRDAKTLFVAANVDESSAGISVSNDATFLVDHGEKWLAIFPARGRCTFEVPGAIPELTDLIISVYRDYQKRGGRLHEAFMRVVPDHGQFLHGDGDDARLFEVKSM